MTGSSACGQTEVSPSGLSRRVGILRSQHSVLAFLFFNPFDFYSSDDTFRNG